MIPDMNSQQGDEKKPVELKEDAKKVASIVINKIQAYGFWCLLIAGIGFWGGVKYCNYTKKDATSETIQLKCFIYNGKVYEIKERIVQ